MAKTPEEKAAEKAAKEEAKAKAKAEKEAAKAAAKAEKDGLKVPDDADLEVKDTKVVKDAVDILGIRDRDGQYGYIRTYSKKDDGEDYLRMAESYVNANPDKKPQIVPHDPAVANAVKGS